VHGKDGTMQEQNAKQNVFDDFIAAAEYLIAQIHPLHNTYHSLGQTEDCL
jgi:protease II